MVGATRVGVFGGAFDPPHLAHLALATSALQQLKLDELRVVPTGQAWHKSRPLSPAQHRLAMAKLAFGGLQKVVVDERETLRAGPSYTIDTLRELKTEQPGIELFLILGGDQARALPTWREYEDVLQCATICIAERQDDSRPKAVPGSNNPLAGQFLHLQMPLSPLSATAIRQRAAAGENVSPLVGTAVARYIAQHHLYSTSA